MRGRPFSRTVVGVPPYCVRDLPLAYARTSRRVTNVMIYNT